MKIEKKLMVIVGIGLLNTMILVLMGLFATESQGGTLADLLDFFKGLAIGINVVATILYIYVLARIIFPRPTKIQD